MRLHPSSVLLAAASLVTGCGGGGSGSGPRTVTLEALPALVGTIADGGYVTPQSLGIGDRAPPSAPQITFRGFLTFDLAALPPGARVVSATLTLHQVRVAGTPYDTLGPLLADQVVYGTVLEAGAYDRSFPTSQGALLSLDATLGPKVADATSQVQADLAANRTLSQWRVRFAVEADGNTSSDQVDLGAPGTSGAAAQPTLTVTYTP